jgi:hypothetical protein
MFVAAQTKRLSKTSRGAEVALEALVAEVGVAAIGEFIGSHAEGDGLTTYLYAASWPGYVGWQWHVVVYETDDDATVNESALMPSAESIVAPPWVPYRDRIRPGDLSPGDLLPVEDDDPRLVPTYSFGDDELSPSERTQVRLVARELGLGRIRTLSTEGIDQAAQRWHLGNAGPDTPLAQSAPDSCSSCGFLLLLSGRLAESFGVCANSDANDDGRVVSFDHGCGAHSEVQLARRFRSAVPPPPALDTLLDFEEF